jgi:DEAD/DEAH box helicase domain-containing protein
VLRRLVTPARADRLMHVEVLAARAAVTAEWPEWTAPELVSALADRGVQAPYRHQVEAADAAWRGRHVIVATGTASGKSLGYLLPTLT